jgi:hypothetical protein
LSQAPRADAARGAYAGIGARETPAEVLEQMRALAERFARAPLVLRTGASPGADQAFLRGAAHACGAVELYLPWPDFEESARAAAAQAATTVFGQPTPAAIELAADFHPRWMALTPASRLLRARDVHQILGADLRTPAAFVVCWTPDGSVDGSGAHAGGTGQALRVAAHHHIPVVNLAAGDGMRDALDLLLI